MSKYQSFSLLHKQWPFKTWVGGHFTGSIHMIFQSLRSNLNRKWARPAEMKCEAMGWKTPQQSECVGAGRVSGGKCRALQRCRSFSNEPAQATKLQAPNADYENERIVSKTQQWEGWQSRHGCFEKMNYNHGPRHPVQLQQLKQVQWIWDQIIRSLEP